MMNPLFDVSNMNHIWTVETAPEPFASLNRPPAIPPSQVRGSVRAYVNHGRWVVDCPFCNSAALASDANPVYFCKACCMAQNAACALAVRFPAERRTIETILLMRPSMDHRNWRWNESVAQLARENLEHGCTRRLF